MKFLNSHQRLTLAIKFIKQKGLYDECVNSMSDLPNLSSLYKFLASKDVLDWRPMSISLTFNFINIVFDDVLSFFYGHFILCFEHKKELIYELITKIKLKYPGFSDFDETSFLKYIFFMKRGYIENAIHTLYNLLFEYELYGLADMWKNYFIEQIHPNIPKDIFQAFNDFNTEL